MVSKIIDSRVLKFLVETCGPVSFSLQNCLIMLIILNIEFIIHKGEKYWSNRILFGYSTRSVPDTWFTWSNYLSHFLLFWDYLKINWRFFCDVIFSSGYSSLRFQPSVAFVWKPAHCCIRIETSILICITDQVTGFHMNAIIGWIWVKIFCFVIASTCMNVIWNMKLSI